MTVNNATQPHRVSAAHLKAPASKTVTPSEMSDRVSAASLTVSTREQAHSYLNPADGRSTLDVRDASSLDGLRALRDKIAPDASKHDQVVILITALITDGVRIGGDIVAALVTLNYNRRYAGIVLSKKTGNSPLRNRWRKDADGRYSLLE